MTVRDSPMSATKDIFISYARKASSEPAERLRASLESLGIRAFMDSSNLELGERFPGALAHAILASRIVVVFVEDLYFESWYCRRRENNWDKACAALLGVLTYARCQRAARDIVVQLCQLHAAELYSEGTKKREPFKGGERAALAVDLGRRAGLILRNLGRYRESSELLRSVMVSGFYLLNDPENELSTQLELCRSLEDGGEWRPRGVS